MVESEGYLHYRNKSGRSRVTPIDTAQRETSARWQFLETFLPELHRSFQQQQVDAAVEVIGSVAQGAAIESSDIDLLISRIGDEDLDRVISACYTFRSQMSRKRELPYEVHYLFSSFRKPVDKPRD